MAEEDKLSTKDVDSLASEFGLGAATSSKVSAAPAPANITSLAKEFGLTAAPGTSVAAPIQTIENKLSAPLPFYPLCLLDRFPLPTSNPKRQTIAIHPNAF